MEPLVHQNDIESSTSNSLKNCLQQRRKAEMGFFTVRLAHWHRLFRELFLGPGVATPGKLSGKFNLC